MNSIIKRINAFHDFMSMHPARHTRPPDNPHAGSLPAAFLATALSLLLLAPIASATWSGDPAVNMQVVSGAGSQVVPYIIPAPDGGAYVSWYDGGAGYDVRLQRLNAIGEKQWAENGVLVRDTDFSSVMDYGIAVDMSGNVLLAFIANTPTGDHVVANLVSPQGALLWGDGIQLTSGSDYYAAPVAAVFAGNCYTVAWISSSVSVVQRLDATGAPLWGTGVTLTDPGGGTLMVADMKGTEDGCVILDFVQYITFTGAKHLFAQKINATGTPVWGDDPIPVFDSGSLQFGNFPDFTSDGTGGAVFSWYDTSANLQCSVQHIAANGTEVFPHNGVVVSTNSSQQRTSPTAVYNPTAGDVFVFWVETNSNQSQWGVYGQKISSAGVRQWTDSGKVIVPVDSMDNQQVCVLPLEDGAVVSFMEEVSLLNYHLYASRVDAAGDFVWNPQIVELSTADSSKGNHTVCRSTTASMFHVWEDNRTGTDDIYGQNVNPDGTLGNGSGPTPTPTEEPCIHDGDVNLDDELSAGDAQMAFLIVLGSYTPTVEQECAADCNGDDEVTAGDAQLIFLAVLGTGNCEDGITM